MDHRGTAVVRSAGMELATHRRNRSRDDRDLRQFQRLVSVSLAPLLVLAVIGRLTGWRWQPWPPVGGERGSVLQEARSAAENSVAFSYLGG